MRSWVFAVVLVVGACGGGGSKPTKPTPPAGSGSAVVAKPEPAKPVEAPKPVDPLTMDCKDLTCLIAQMDAFQKKMCDCKDKKCADKVQADFTEWGTKIGDKPELRDLKPSDDETKKATEIVQNYMQCMMKYMNGEDEPPPPTNTGLGGGLKK